MAPGWYRMHRGWMDDPLFASEPFSRAQAFEWLIANAAWEPHSRWFKGHLVTVERGQLVTSEAELSSAWKWPRQRVRTFLKHLETDEKSTRETTSGRTKLTICNYSKYQTEQPAGQPTEQPEANQGATKEQPTIEEEKEVKKGKKEEKEESARFAFFGRTIKVNARDLDAWRTRFHAILDLEAELFSLDAWFETQDEKTKKDWYWRTISALGRKHQEVLERRAAEQRRDDGYDPNVITV